MNSVYMSVFSDLYHSVQQISFIKCGSLLYSLFVRKNVFIYEA